MQLSTYNLSSEHVTTKDLLKGTFSCLTDAIPLFLLTVN